MRNYNDFIPKHDNSLNTNLNYLLTAAIAVFLVYFGFHLAMICLMVGMLIAARNKRNLLRDYMITLSDKYDPSLLSGSITNEELIIMSEFNEDDALVQAKKDHVRLLTEGTSGNGTFSSERYTVTGYIYDLPRCMYLRKKARQILDLDYVEEELKCSGSGKYYWVIFHNSILSGSIIGTAFIILIKTGLYYVIS